MDLRGKQVHQSWCLHHDVYPTTQGDQLSTFMRRIVHKLASNASCNHPHMACVPHVSRIVQGAVATLQACEPSSAPMERDVCSRWQCVCLLTSGRFLEVAFLCVSTRCGVLKLKDFEAGALHRGH